MIEIPTAVYVIWIIVLLVAVFVILPLTVFLLHRVLKAARSIERYLGEMRDAGMGIAGNTGHIKALDDTISVATEILDTAGKLDEHSAAIEQTLAARASSSGESQKEA